MIGWQIGFWLARQHERKGELEKALKTYMFLHRHGAGSNSRVLYRLGHVLFSLNQLEESKSYLSKAVQASPEIPEWHYRLAFVCERLRDYPAAEQHYGDAIKLRDKNAQWRYRRGRVLDMLGRKDEASTEYKNAIQNEPDNAKYHAALAKSLRENSAASWQQLEVLQAGADHHSQDVDWQLRLAQVLEELNRHEEAAIVFSNAASLDSNRPFLHYREGYSKQRAGDNDGAHEAFERAINLDKKLSAKELGIGVFHEARGLWKPALDAYLAKAEELAYQPKSLNLRITRCYEKLGLWPEATERLMRIVAQDPQDVDSHLSLARALGRAGDYRCAENVYQYALTRLEESSRDSDYEWRYRYGLVLEANGEFEAAAHQYLASTGDPITQANTENGPEHLQRTSSDPKTAHEESTQSTFQFDHSQGSYINWVLKNSTDLALPSQDLSVLISARDFAMQNTRYEAAENFARQIVQREPNDSTSHKVALGLSLTMQGAYQDACKVLRTTRSGTMQNETHKPKRYPGGTWTAEVIQYYQYQQELPLEPQTVLYESHLGASIDCNPLAIFRRIIDDPKYSTLTHVWVTGANCVVPAELRNNERVVLVPYNSPLYRRYLATAKYLINNVTFQNYFVRRAGQKYLNTWHGTPFKTLGKHMGGRALQHSNVARNFLQATHILSPGPHTTKVLTEGYDVDGLVTAKVSELGYPRYDMTSNLSGHKRKRIESALGIDVESGRPVVLYAPTWRGDVDSSKFDVDRLVTDLNALADVDAQILFRAHPISEELLEGLQLDVTVVPRDINSNDLLAVIDILITDYSSILFDAKACGIPVFLYIYDFEDYVIERGVYFDPQRLTPHTFNDISTLCLELASVGVTAEKASVSRGRDDTGESLAALNDGNASKRAIAFFFEDSDQYVVNGGASGKISVLFRASLIPNGVTSAFLNLVSQLDSTKYAITLLVDSKVLAEDEARLSKFEELPSHVRVVGRVGPRVALPDEKWQETLLSSQHNLWSSESWELYLESFRREYRRLFGDTRFDYVVEYDGYSLFWASLLSVAEPRRGSLMYLHSEMHKEWLSRAAYLEGIFRLYSRFDRLVCVSDAIAESNADELSSRFSIDTTRFVGGGNFLNESKLRELAMEAPDADVMSWLDGSDQFVITVGRISPEKDQMKLLRSFSRVVVEFPEAKLVVVGDGPQSGSLEILVKHLGLESNVYLAGYRKNPFPLMSRASAFVLSSNHEGQPMVLLEALALGLPVISTDIRGARAVLGDLGNLVDNSAEGLADGLIEFLRGSRRREAFDVAGYNRSLLHKFESVVLEV